MSSNTPLASRRSSLTHGVYRASWRAIGHHTGFTIHARERAASGNWGPWRRAVWFATMHDFRSWADNPLHRDGRAELFDGVLLKVRALDAEDRERPA